MIDVISLCDRTRLMVKPWEDFGFNCLTVDIESSQGNHLRGDVRNIELPQAKIIVSFPPCTHLANSGARWWKSKGQEAFDDAKSIVIACENLVKQAKIGGFIENPRGRISSILGPSTHKFHPWNFTEFCKSDDYSKETHLWFYGNIVMPGKRVRTDTIIDTTRIHYNKNGRDFTPKGFAVAFFEANRSLVERYL